MLSSRGLRKWEISASRRPSAPERFPAHWGLNGQVDRYRSCLERAGGYVSDWGYVQDFAQNQTQVTLSFLVHPGKIHAAVEAVRSQPADLLQLTVE